MSHNCWHILILGTILFFLGAVSADTKLGQTLRNDTHNYVMSVPLKWKAVPVDPKEKYETDKFQAPRGDSDNLQYKMTVMVFNTTKIVVTENRGISFGKSGEEPEIGSKEWKEQFEKDIEELSRITSFDDYLKQTKEYDSYAPKLLKRYEIPWKRARNGKAQVYEMGWDKNHSNAEFARIACVYRQGNVEYVVEYSIGRKEIDEADEKKVYLDSFATFNLTKEATGSKKEIVDVTKLPPHKRREAVKKGLPKGWYAVDTKNYVILSNVKDRKFINEVATHAELIRQKYEELFPPKEKIEALSVIRVCGSANEYFGYGGPRGSAGYFSSYSKEMVLFDDIALQEKNTIAVLYHECFHQYTYYFFGELSAHRWYDEGLGDYFAGAKLREGRFSIEKFDWRVETIRNGVKANKHYPIEKFVRLTHKQYYEDADLCYAQGWAFIYFLQNTRNARWRQILNLYIEALAEKDPSDSLSEEQRQKKAVDKAFEGIDYNQIDKAFTEFVSNGFKN